MILIQITSPAVA